MATEIWRSVVGFDGFYEGTYEISSLGRVRSIDRVLASGNFAKGRIRTQLLDIGGYPVVGLYKDGKGNQRKVHRLVALAFIPNPDNKPVVNHRDGNKQNNSVENLEWVTNRENTNHAYQNGLIKAAKGEKNSQAKLTVELVSKAKELYALGWTYKAIGELIGVGGNQVSRIIKGTRWGHLNAK
jgi:hypothetical protein